MIKYYSPLDKGWFLKNLLRPYLIFLISWSDCIRSLTFLCLPPIRVSHNFPSVGYLKLFLLMEVWGYIWWGFHKNQRDILKIHCEIRILTFLALKRSFIDIWHSWLHSWGSNASFDTHIDIQWLITNHWLCHSTKHVILVINDIYDINDTDGNWECLVSTGQDGCQK